MFLFIYAAAGKIHRILLYLGTLKMTNGPVFEPPLLRMQQVGLSDEQRTVEP